MLGQSLGRAGAAAVLLALILWNVWVAHTMVATYLSAPCADRGV